MKHSDKSNFPRIRKSSANAFNILSITFALTQLWKYRWQVWYGGYRSGRSCHGAPVRNIQRTPFKTSHIFFRGLPLFVFFFSFGSNGSNISFCSWLKSITRLLYKSSFVISFLRMKKSSALYFTYYHYVA